MHLPRQNTELSKTLAMDALATAGIHSLFSDPEVLSGGRSNDVWKVSSISGSFVVKLFKELDDNPLFPNDAAHEQAALEHYCAFGLAPEIFASGQNWIIYRFVDAPRWHSGAERVGAALARLHAVKPLSCARRLPSGSEALTIQSDRILANCPRHLRQEMACPPLHSSVAEFGGTCGLHGDPVPGNILCPKGKTLFIDWQCPAIGDPCEDIAIFLSPAMQTTYRGEPLSKKEHVAFWSGYANFDIQERYERLKPFFHLRMMAYCLWRCAHRQENPDAALAAERLALAECS